MPILINKTYELITQESSKNGSVAESGFEFEDQPFTFRELVNEMRNYSEASQSPINNVEWTWLTSEPDHDYKSGDEMRYSLHYSRDNKPRSLKYWEKAMRKVGLLK